MFFNFGYKKESESIHHELTHSKIKITLMKLIMPIVIT